MLLWTVRGMDGSSGGEAWPMAVRDAKDCASLLSATATVGQSPKQRRLVGRGTHSREGEGEESDSESERL